MCIQNVDSGSTLDARVDSSGQTGHPDFDPNYPQLVPRIVDGIGIVISTNKFDYVNSSSLINHM